MNRRNYQQWKANRSRILYSRVDYHRAYPNYRTTTAAIVYASAGSLGYLVSYGHSVGSLFTLSVDRNVRDRGIIAVGIVEAALYRRYLRILAGRERNVPFQDGLAYFGCS